MKKKYQEQKQKARALAIKWQAVASEGDRDTAYFIEWADRFQRIGRKFGLLREFKENCII